MKQISRKLRVELAKTIYRVWWWLPLPSAQKQAAKGYVFKRLKFLLKDSGAYRAWSEITARAKDDELVKIGLTTDMPVHTEVVPYKEYPKFKEKRAKIVAFYLPQFHAIPENDQWWGEGFTEWTNVRPASPQFEGHYQPHIPMDLGYYDLSDSAVQHHQIEIAKNYGLGGFCFYFYWFGGKRLLEKPLENWLNDQSLDFPFCLCWANENWSRRWDGLESEILIEQRHSSEDDLAFIKAVSVYLKDPRYICIDGRPLLIVYRPSLLPSPVETAQRWRDWCRRNGVGEIYLAYTQSFELDDPELYGFDGAIEFPPNKTLPLDITKDVIPASSEFKGVVCDLRSIARRSEYYQEIDYKLFRSCCPGWDNTPRRKENATVFDGASPQLFSSWVRNALFETNITANSNDEKIIFINAWNEWAEGAHLEPDERHGYAYLQALRNALEDFPPENLGRLLIVTHDTLPHGAPYLALAIGRALRKLGYQVSFLALRAGDLLRDFMAIGDVFVAYDHSEDEKIAFLASERANGTRGVILNTVVSGSEAKAIKELGFSLISLIHELPGVIRAMKQEENAAQIAEWADFVMYPSDLVRDEFRQFAQVGEQKVLVRNQGVIRSNRYKFNKFEARKIFREQLDLDDKAKIILTMAFFQPRKGLDILVEAADYIAENVKDAAFVCIGEIESGSYAEEISSLLDRCKSKGRFYFLGYQEDPMVYFAGADVFALPSREDPFPNVVLESLEVKVPVVAFQRATGAAKLIEENGGRLATPFNVSDFAKNIVATLEESNLSDIKPVGSMNKYVQDIIHNVVGFLRVSVIIPNFNYSSYLKRRIVSVLNQSYPIYEIIFLDDCSQDDSLSVALTILGAQDTVEFEIVSNEVNSGSVFRQWEKGLSRCSGDLVWIAEADDFSDREFLATLVGSFADKEMVLAYCQSRQIDEAGGLLASDYLEYTSDVSDRWKNDHTSDGLEEVREGMAVKNVIPNVSAVVFRTCVLRKVIDEIRDELPSYRVGGDWLTYMHVLRRGKVSFFSKSLNFHRRHRKSVTRVGDAMAHFQEVVALQRVAREIAVPSPETLQKAEMYLRKLKVHFGFDSQGTSSL